jgi:lipopolysaccharide export system protein LptA
VKYLFTFCFVMLIALGKLFAQKPIVTPSADTVRIVQIIQSNNLRQKLVDSAEIETAAGNVIMKEGTTIFYCDSVVINRKTNIVEAFGNIHINNNDSIHTYAQYLKYVALDRTAFLKKNVRLTDKKGTIFTDEMEYNLRTGIGIYKNGGRVVNGSTVLTSTDGVYYSDTKDVYFKKNVHLIDPKYDIKADSLLFNTQTQIATFISPTRITSKDQIVDTKSGTYNLKTGNALFFDRTLFRDSTHFGIADRIALDDKNGLVQMEGNAKLVDSTNFVTVVGNQILLNKKNNSFLATRKPVMILYRDNDSTYVAADTLFSGINKYDSIAKMETSEEDTLKKPSAINTSDTALRYFIAFHHVRIFNDSLQAVSDSLHYSNFDSTFKLFGEPVAWNGNTQVTGDTMHLYTQNKKPKRLYVFYNGMVINKANDAMYNQIAGRTLNAYFKDGDIDYVRAKGSPAESVFYPQDDDSAYVGMNRNSSDVIDAFFIKKELDKVKFVNNVDGVMYPVNQIPADKKYLPNYKWLDKRRPKNKLELFE